MYDKLLKPRQSFRITLYFKPRCTAYNYQVPPTPLPNPIFSVCVATKSGATHGNHFHKHECGVLARQSGEATLPLLSMALNGLSERKQSFFYYYSRIDHLKSAGFGGMVFGILAFLVFRFLWPCIVSKTWRECSHPTTQRPTTATNHIQQNQNNTPNAVTGPLFSWRWA